MCCSKDCRLLSEPSSVLKAAIETCYASADPQSITHFDSMLSSLPQRRPNDGLELLNQYNEIDRIKVLIENCKVLAKYGLNFTIGKMREISDDPDNCFGLLNDLMVHILRSNNTKDKSSNFFWSCVLADGIKLVDSFTSSAIERDEWLTIYAKHLLMFNASGGQSGGGFSKQLGKLIDVGNLIGVAKTVLTFSHNQTSEKQQGSPSLSYAKSARLAVIVAKELFESAADLDDLGLSRAQQCLDLISKQYVSIDDELGIQFNEVQCLLECCQLMKQLEAPVVPLALKVSGDRLGLLANVVNASTEACLRNHKSFLRLAEMLQIADSNDESHNLGLKLLANSAVSSGNLEAAQTYCQRIVQANFSLAWQECALLCESKVVSKHGLKDAAEVLPLLTFALKHCDSPNRMRTLMTIRQRIVAEHCSYCLQPDAEQVAGKVVGKVVTTVAKEIGDRTSYGWTKASTLPIVSTIAQTLSNVRVSQESDSEEEKNQTIPQLDAFSSSDIGAIKQYLKSRTNSASDLALMLRLACITLSEKQTEDASLDGELKRHVISLAKQIGKYYVEEDIAFTTVDFIALAVGNGDAQLLDEFLASVTANWPPSDPKMAVLCAYIIAFYIELVHLNKDSTQLLKANPIKVILDCQNALEGNDFGALGSKFSKIIEMLLKMDESQSVSKKLPPGIDVDMFLADEEYRKKTVCFIADDNFEEACELAERFQIPIEPIRMRYVKTNLQKEEFDEEKLEAVMKLLPSDALEKMFHECLLKIDGFNYPRLIAFIKFGKRLEADALFPNKSLEIVTILKEVSVLQTFSFHSIVTNGPGESEIEELIQTCIDEGTDAQLKMIVKLVELAPGSFSVDRSGIYRRFSTRKFLSLVSKLATIDANALQPVVEQCEPSLLYLKPNDFSAFLFDVFSSEQLIRSSFPVVAKHALIKRFIQSLKTIRAKRAKAQSPLDWSPCQDAFRTLARHLDRLNNSSWLQLELVADSALYAEIRRDFDETLSREKQVTAFLANWLSRLPGYGAGLGPEVVELLLTCVDFKEKGVKEGYMECFQHQLISGCDPSPLVLAISRWSKLPGKSGLVTDIYLSLREIVFTVVIHGKGLANNAQISPQQRLKLLNSILKASGGQLNLSKNMMKDADFIYLQAIACVEGTNTIFEVGREDVENEESRARLLERVAKELPWNCIVEMVKLLPRFDSSVLEEQAVVPSLKMAAAKVFEGDDKNVSRLCQGLK